MKILRSILKSRIALAVYVVALVLLLPYISTVAFLCVVVAVILLSMFVSNRRLGRILRCFYLAQRIGKVTIYPTPKEHKCMNCGNVFVGNFCPFCGQSSNIQPNIKFGGWLKQMCLSMMKFGGGMGRTLIDLLWRPGFLIRDYLVGRRMKYASPYLALIFMMFIWPIVKTDFPIEQKPHATLFSESTVDKKEGQELMSIMDYIEKSEANAKVKVTIDDFSKRFTFGMKLLRGVKEFVVDNSQMFRTLLLCFPILTIAMSLPFRRQTVVGRRLNLAEYLVVECYMISLMFVVVTMLYVTGHIQSALPSAFLIMIATFRQLFDGFSWPKAALYALIVVAIIFIILAFFVVLGSIVFNIDLSK